MSHHDEQVSQIRPCGEELKEIARQYLRLEETLKVLNTKLEEARKETEKCSTAMKNLQESLNKSVGLNIQERHFLLEDNKIVRVRHKLGVDVIEPE